MTNLKYLRKKNYGRAYELARLLSVSDVAVYRWEHGNMPNEYSKMRLEKLFGKSIDFLLGEYDGGQ